MLARDSRALLAEDRARRAEPDEEVTTRDPDEDVLDLTDARQLPQPAAPPPPVTGAPAPLVADAAARGMRGSLASLAATKATAPPASARVDDSALEALVRELLRPALAAWLDRNLPPLVERLVAAEIARIVGERE